METPNNSDLGYKIRKLVLGKLNSDKTNIDYDDQGDIIEF